MPDQDYLVLSDGVNYFFIEQDISYIWVLFLRFIHSYSKYLWLHVIGYKVFGIERILIDEISANSGRNP